MVDGKVVTSRDTTQKKQKAKYASVYVKTYTEVKQKLTEAKFKTSIGVVYLDTKNKLFAKSSPVGLMLKKLI